jgi:aspartyl-tRNA(Asn)/glutamyl-tRNA(Gln) amidotransferase subunit A
MGMLDVITLTVPASIPGFPALSVPVAVGGERDCWPLGVSIVRQWGCELMVLAIGGVGATIEHAEIKAE